MLGSLHMNMVVCLKFSNLRQPFAPNSINTPLSWSLEPYQTELSLSIVLSAVSIKVSMFITIQTYIS